MLLPSVFGENLLDDFFDVPSFGGFPANHTSVTNIMHTDVKENNDSYAIDINLPGFKKEDVNAELKNGYLTINAVSNTSKDEKDSSGKYIRRERYSGSCSRSFYVGEDVKQEDIKAKFEDGVLKITLPKKETQPAVEKNNFIAIE